ncbi:MAG TPA: hypothetical protein VFY56_11845, partial [Propionibacteriaceae bacterium]|nr:hypothetical protein [Propionibacteriaceae bacterium]
MDADPQSLNLRPLRSSRHERPRHLVEFPTDVDFLTYEPPGYGQISDHWRVLDSIGGKIRRYSDARAGRT